MSPHPACRLSPIVAVCRNMSHKANCVNNVAVPVGTPQGTGKDVKSVKIKEIHRFLLPFVAAPRSTIW